MVHYVSTAVNVLHLGHEPEQAAMLCVALGRVAGLDGGLVDRVFEALAVRCEAAGACVVNAVALWIFANWGTHCLTASRSAWKILRLPAHGSASACVSLKPSLVCCVRAGDWQAAALALTHLSHDAQHQQVLLAVRQERADRSDSSSSSGSNDAGDNAATTGDTLPGADSSRQAKSSGSLRQALRLPPVEQCAGLARSANGPLESVRWALW